jgi:hypothetical protein
LRHENFRDHAQLASTPFRAGPSMLRRQVGQFGARRRGCLGPFQRGFHVTIFNIFRFFKKCRIVSSPLNSVYSHEIFIISLLINMVLH